MTKRLENPLSPANLSNVPKDLKDFKDFKELPEKNSVTVEDGPLDDNPLWYKDAVIYQLHVRSFQDSDGDGIGDFGGLTQKLDYIKDLGANAIWLLPFYPSPLRDDGYDIAHYTKINPIYGNLKQFQEFLRSAHQKGLRVITELVINHTSDQHPWFQRARLAPPGSVERDFYVWSETPEKYKEARIIFKDFETSNWAFDPVAKSYYWHRFYYHQPDLNFDNPEVEKAVFKVVDFWLKMGVDGLRLDAVPYLYEREGTNCENIPETHAFLKRLRNHVDTHFKNRMLLSEANQWPEDVVAYLGDGDECHMNFHFPLMPRMFMSVRLEDRYPMIDILEQTPEIPANCQWATFLRNHDELTLEMVTDEERDYMYRMYAQEARARVNLGIRRRLAPLLGNNRRQIELMVALLFSLPGTPIIYYGDEIGMGDNIYLGDRNGVRTPLQWTGDRNAGFSQANPQKLYLPVIIDHEYHYEAINIEAQERNPNSLLWWMKRIIKLRKESLPLCRGSLEILYPDNRKVFCFLRKFQQDVNGESNEETILIIANLSSVVQYAEIDLSPYQGMVLFELFGHMHFPPIQDRPYFFTLGPHSFYWFQIIKKEGKVTNIETLSKNPLRFSIRGGWENVFAEELYRKKFERILGQFIQKARWFSGKSKSIRDLTIKEIIPFPTTGEMVYLLFVAVYYYSDEPEGYFLPVTYASGEKAQDILKNYQNSIIMSLRPLSLKDRQEETTETPLEILYDASASSDFQRALLFMLIRRKLYNGAGGELKSLITPNFREQMMILSEKKESELETKLLSAEQSNTTLIFEHQFVFKLFRKLGEGLNPDLEIGLFLSKRSGAPVAKVAGALEFSQGSHEKSGPLTLGILHEFVPNEGNGWNYTLDILSRYYEQALTYRSENGLGPIEKNPENVVKEFLGMYLINIELLGKRTAELHQALGASTKNLNFTREAFSEHYQRSLYQSLRTSLQNNFSLLRKSLGSLPEFAVEMAKKVLESEKKIKEDLKIIFKRRILAQRIRTHGDFHLGQVLFTGKDFIIIDFEGEPERPLSERKIKRSPLRDVAGMIRSFHYAAYFGLRQDKIREEDQEKMLPWAKCWYQVVSKAYLKSYFQVLENDPLLPASYEDRDLLLKFYLVEKALYEIGYELNNRPSWTFVPLQGILDLIESPPEGG